MNAHDPSALYDACNRAYWRAHNHRKAGNEARQRATDLIAGTLAINGPRWRASCRLMRIAGLHQLRAERLDARSRKLGRAAAQKGAQPTT